MNSKFIEKYCKVNNITFNYSPLDLQFKVYKGISLLYSSSSYDDCICYLTEVIINDKHTNNR